MSETHEQRIPASALRFKIGEFQLSDNGEGGKTAPIRLVARAGKPIDHPYFGSVVHDFASMDHKTKIPIDYGHNESEIIGFVNKFDTVDGDLVLSGTVVPFRSGDRAAEVMHKAKAGVPYEASIDFRAPMQMEMLGAGKQQMVNGSMVDGPATIIKNWTLRGVAVCPYGADSGTSTQFAAGDEITVTVLSEEPQPMAEVETPEVVAEVVPAAPQFSAADALKQFGTDGAIWFAEGKTQSEMQTLHAAKDADRFKTLAAELAAVNTSVNEKFAAIEQRLSALVSAGGAGEKSPVAFGSGEDKEQKRQGFASRFATSPVLLAGARAAGSL